MDTQAHTNKLYLLTGATGHLGSVVLEALLARGKQVRCLVLPGTEGDLPKGVPCVLGDICETASLEDFFAHNGAETLSLIHCAAQVSIATHPRPSIWETNVEGTKNIMQAALDAHVERAVYVSSVHAIPVPPEPTPITETDEFSQVLVHGAYAKTKAEAVRCVLEFANMGLNVSIVHPSGIIGPGDSQGSNHMVRTIRAMDSGAIPIAVSGGYDFVDSRDVSQGILLCEEKGERGACYILSGHYTSIADCLRIVNKIRGRKRPSLAVPAQIVMPFARIAEQVSERLGNTRPLLTPYSLYTLQVNANFSNAKAREELGYTTRPIEESIRDTLLA